MAQINPDFDDEEFDNDEDLSGEEQDDLWAMEDEDESEGEDRVTHDIKIENSLWDDFCAQMDD